LPVHATLPPGRSATPAAFVLASEFGSHDLRQSRVPSELNFARNAFAVIAVRRSPTT
jgi:hypothetical protein